MSEYLYSIPPSAEAMSPQYKRLVMFLRASLRLRLSKIVITGQEHILPAGPKVDAYSHYTDWSDIILAGHSEAETSGLPERFMAKASYFKIPLVAKAFYNLDGFPVDQDGTDLSSIEHAANLLSLGHRVAIAPQAESIIDPNARPKLKRGVGMIAIIGGAPIQPKAIVGRTHRVPFYDRKLFEASRLLPTVHVPRLSYTRQFVVRYGEAVDLPEGAEEFTLDRLERTPNEETGRQEIVIPRELSELAVKYSRVWMPAFYENYEQGLRDFQEIYGRAA